MPVRIYCILALSLVLFASVASAQDNSAQFSSELRFARPVATRWAGEFTFTNLWMQSPPANGLFSQYSQYSLGGWAHNYISSKWRLSAGLLYYHKIESEDPLQIKSNEFRFTAQGIYYIKKIGYTITSRSRVEWRNIQDTAFHYNSLLRFREQVKLIVPINAKSIREGVYYGFASEEVFFKTPSDVAGNEFFDRNRVEIGMGYSFTRDINVELYYTNEFLPRTTDQVVHIINLDFSFRNLIENLKEKFFTPNQNVPDE